MVTCQFACSKRSAIGDIVDWDDDIEHAPYEASPSKTLSDRKVRKTNSLNMVFNSRYRNPDNQELPMGELQPLGKAYTILAVMMHGPVLPAEKAQHDERRRISLWRPHMPCQRWYWQYFKSLSPRSWRAAYLPPQVTDNQLSTHRFIAVQRC